MDLSVYLFYEDENHDANINVFVYVEKCEMIRILLW